MREQKERAISCLVGFVLGCGLPHSCMSHMFTCDSVCLIRFSLVQKHTVEFNQVAMANSEGSEAMLNRVMTKDNIGVAVVLEVHKELFGASKYEHGYLIECNISLFVKLLPLAEVTKYLQTNKRCSLY